MKLKTQTDKFVWKNIRRENINTAYATKTNVTSLSLKNNEGWSNSKLKPFTKEDSPRTVKSEIVLLFLRHTKHYILL